MRGDKIFTLPSRALSLSRMYTTWFSTTDTENACAYTLSDARISLPLRVQTQVRTFHTLNFQRLSRYTTLLTTSVLSRPVRVFLYKYTVYHTIDKILWQCHLFTLLS